MKKIDDQKNTSKDESQIGFNIATHSFASGGVLEGFTDAMGSSELAAGGEG